MCGEQGLASSTVGGLFRSPCSFIEDGPVKIHGNRKAAR
jgi:hypothetical protein